MRRNKKPLNRRQRHAIAVMEAGHKRKPLLAKAGQRAKLFYKHSMRLSEDVIASLTKEHWFPSIGHPSDRHRMFRPRDNAEQEVQPVFSAKAMHERINLDEITHGTVKELIKQILD